MQGQKVEPRIRQVAILLTLVDTTTARQLLGQMPTDQAKQIRQAMVHLGRVTQQEQQQAMQMFHKLQPQASARVKATNLSPAESALVDSTSTADRLEISQQARDHAFSQSHTLVADESAVRSLTDSASASGTHSGSVWNHLGASELSDVLRHERAIVVAVVLNQVSIQLATEVIDRLESEMASEALALLPALQYTDPEILSEIHLHLQKSIADYERPRQAAEQGMQRIQAILQGAMGDKKNRLIQSLSMRQPQLAVKLGLTSSMDASQAISPSSTEKASKPNRAILELNDAPMNLSVSSASESMEKNDSPTLLPFPKSQVASTAPPSSTSSGDQVQIPFDDLVQLSADDLSIVLKSCEANTILLALSGSSVEFYARFKSMLHPRDAKRLDARLTTLGPVQIRDIDQAQLQLARRAGQLLAQGRIGSLMNMTFTAAA